MKPRLVLSRMMQEAEHGRAASVLSERVGVEERQKWVPDVEGAAR